MSSEHKHQANMGNEQAERGFFSIRSVRPSEVDNDNDSYVLVDNARSSVSDDLPAPPFIAKEYSSPRPLVTMLWRWFFGGVVLASFALLPLVIICLAGQKIMPHPRPFTVLIRYPSVPIASFFALPILLSIFAGIILLPYYDTVSR